MKKEQLFHPRIFNTQEWAEGYYKRNKKNIKMVGKRFTDILENLNFQKGRILDMGCGFGTVAIEIAKKFPDSEITGIDLGEPLLKLGQSLVREAGFDKMITLKKGDVQETEFDNDLFDVVINTFMLHIVERPIKMLNEIERIAKPDGKILITDLRRNWLGLFIKKFRTAYTIEEAKRIINESKIREAEITKGFFWWDYLPGV